MDIYDVEGAQRLQQPRRLDDIAEYINRVDAAFPNSIILAANYRPEDGLIEGDTDDERLEVQETAKRWRIEEAADGCLRLTIPTGEKLAAIVDGQHRLFAFAKAASGRRSFEMLCAIFVDLPRPMQAQLFARINSTQKPVDKSLTYEMFGYNVDDELPSFWSPDKLAVFLTRRLGFDDASPMKGRIIVAPENEFEDNNLKNRPWQVSTAVVVMGIVRLISTNPKRDANALQTPKQRQRPEISSNRVDKSPLRSLYLAGNDALVYAAVLNFMRASNTAFWIGARSDSYILKTVGIQALLDILRITVADALARKDVSEAYFTSLLRRAAHIDFSADRFRNPSGAGRNFIRKVIGANLGIPAELSSEDRAAFVKDA